MPLFRYTAGIFLIIIALAVALICLSGFKTSVLYSVAFFAIALFIGYGGVKLIRRANRLENELPEREDLITSDDELGEDFTSLQTIGQMDLTKLSPVGCSLMIASAAVCMVVVFATVSLLDLKGNKNRFTSSIVSIVALGIGGTAFVGGRLLLKKMGYSLFRQPPEVKQKSSQTDLNPDDPWE